MIGNLLRHLKNYKAYVLGNIVCNIMMVFFQLAGLPLFIPFLNILFDRQEIVAEAPVEELSFDSAPDYANYWISQIILEQGKEAALAYLCAGIVVLFFGKNLFRYGSLFFMAPVRNGIVRDLRGSLFKKMLVLPLSYFSEERKGDLMSRLTADVQEIEWSILNVLEIVFREPLMLLGTLGFMLYISPSLTLFVLGLLLFVGLIIGGIGKVLKRQSGAVQEQLGDLVSQVEEGLGGLRVVKGFGAETFLGSKFDQANNRYRHLLVRLLWRRDLSSPLTEFLGVTTVAVLIYYGYHRVQMGDLQVATFFTFLIAFYGLIEPAKKFSNASYNVRKGMAAVERVDRILTAPLRIVDAPNAKPIEKFEREIRYENVRFRYPNSDRLVLDNIDLTVARGKVIALVGASGGGKSTLVDLLPRFYDLKEGRILIDGTNIKDYQLADLRDLFGIVTQEAVLFNDTIYNNIAFGSPKATPDTVRAAARIANAHEFIEQTEHGYESTVGDRGGKLSGGQRQRITIARAVLRDPPILILDEATSALDSESERAVQDALERVMKNRTALVIAHRLSTVRHADEIIVLRDGQIVERGTHEELLTRNEEYGKLVALQGFA